MIEDVMIKSHLIITDIHEEYNIKWLNSIKNTNPILHNGLPIFVLISSTSRVELNTIDIKQIEKMAKKITNPRGRAAITTDKTRIYIKEKDNKETCVGVVTHNHVKKYAPMFDPVRYRAG